LRYTNSTLDNRICSFKSTTTRKITELVKQW